MLKATLLALAILLGATAAHAADACYQDGFGDILVFKKFKLPRAGDCQPLNGYQSSSNCLLDGTVCGTSDNTRVRFHFNYTCQTAGFGTYFFFTDRLYNVGDGQACQENLSNGVWTCPTFLVSKITCPTTRNIQ